MNKMITDLTDSSEISQSVKSEKSVIRNKKEISNRKEESVLNDINTTVICKQMQ